MLEKQRGKVDLFRYASVNKTGKKIGEEEINSAIQLALLIIHGCKTWSHFPDRIMKNPLIKLVENELKEFGFENVKLIHSSFDEENFGNAEAVYEIKNFRLHFVRDRNQNLLSVSSVISPKISYPFCDVSLAMGWENLNEIINVTEPISLKKALGFIKNDLDRFNDAFSAEELLTTNLKLQTARSKRVKAMFG